MTPNVEVLHKTMNPLAIKDLAAHRGPCISLFIQDHHPGAQAGSRLTLIRGLLDRAENILNNNRKLKPHTTELLAPLVEVADTDKVAQGGPGLGFFRSPHFLEVFELPGTTESNLVVASHFALLPLVERVYAPQNFYILGLSRKHLRLLRFRSGRCEELVLPPQVPESLEAAGAFKPPDHDLENRSTAGVGAGSMKAVHFGTLTDREAAGEHLAHFFTLISRGLKDTLKDSPLVLAGVHEEVASYRRASKYPRLLASEIAGNIEFLSLEEIAVSAAAAAREQYRHAGLEALAELKEMTDRSRVLTGNPHQVLRAAAAGRIHRLCVREGISVHGPMERELDNAHLGAEDLVNAAVVETIRHGGEVFVIPADHAAASEPLAAVLRY